ncbi:hypothetical protein B9G98_03209 [Wickerhamiella sorbophila]|uniref:Mso1 N-terminal domain-containing protein n=1 Tax=Wickerhamiella sorbophila TaxID=45607 RepID=A0A2T0FKT3_9ASCO|nr:hypothetical protein B9G98_03209 [Wickerhamiella sorbophila]PRT55589.1 hypothetical protein B9G98_03209 [Wickerhamiella sorbophila]
MSLLWGKFRGKVDSVSTSLQGMSISRTEKDRNEDDTVISRALYRYYNPSPPEWLVQSTPSLSPTASMGALPNTSGQGPDSARPRLQSRSTTDFSHIYSRQSSSRASVSTERRPSHSPAPFAEPDAPPGAQAHTGRGKFSKLRHANW